MVVALSSTASSDTLTADGGREGGGGGVRVSVYIPHS